MTTHWPLGVAVRPPVDPDAATVEVADTVTGRRFQARPEALAAAILRDEVPAPVGDLPGRAHLVDGWRHWHRRGWYPSDGAYVASRRWDYADAVDPGDRIREKTIGGYLAADGEPPAAQVPDGLVVPLGEPAEPGDQSVSRLLRRRRSGRAYVAKDVPLATLSGVIWYGLTGIRQRRRRLDPDYPLSMLDSYGSAWDIALSVYGVEGVEPGFYRYDLREHELRQVAATDGRKTMSDVLQGMNSPATAAWTLGLVADFPRYQWRYRHEHALRRLWFETGVIGQELLLLASSYGMSTLVTPAQKDRPYLRLHGFDDRRYSCVYTLTQGLARGSGGVELNGHEIEQVPR